MNIEQILQLAQDAHSLGARAYKQGAYSLAAMRYTQALGMLQALRVMIEDIGITLPKKSEEALAMMIMLVETGLTKVRVAQRNGHKNPSRRDDFKRALDEMIQELRETLG